MTRRHQICQSFGRRYAPSDLQVLASDVEVVHAVNRFLHCLGSSELQVSESPEIHALKCLLEKWRLSKANVNLPVTSTVRLLRQLTLRNFAECFENVAQVGLRQVRMHGRDVDAMVALRLLLDHLDDWFRLRHVGRTIHLQHVLCYALTFTRTFKQRPERVRPSMFSFASKAASGTSYSTNANSFRL